MISTYYKYVSYFYFSSSYVVKELNLLLSILSTWDNAVITSSIVSRELKGILAIQPNDIYFVLKLIDFTFESPKLFELTKNIS